MHEWGVPGVLAEWLVERSRTDYRIRQGRRHDQRVPGRPSLDPQRRRVSVVLFPASTLPHDPQALKLRPRPHQCLVVRTQSGRSVSAGFRAREAPRAAPPSAM